MLERRNYKTIRNHTRSHQKLAELCLQAYTAQTMTNRPFLIVVLILSVLAAEAKAARKPECWKYLDSGLANANKTLRVAAVQFPLAERATGDQLIAKVEDYVRQAKAGNADVVLFPELITTELVNWESPIAETVQLTNIAREFTPRYIAAIQAMADQFQIAVLGGSTPRWVDGKILNTAILAMPGGEVLLQDKIYLTPDEKVWGWEPGTALNVFDTPWGKTVITICFDSEFPGVSQMLASHRPEVFLVPSWTSTEAGFNRVDWATKGRSIEHYAFVIKTATVPDSTSTQPHFGNAAITGPQDIGFPIGPIATGPLHKDAVVFGDLDLPVLRARRLKSGYQPVHEQEIRQLPIQVIEP